jgi:4-hydroxy-tetrahydrodipicolinate synthase
VATAPEQERLEAWIMEEVEKGAALPASIRRMPRTRPLRESEEINADELNESGRRDAMKREDAKGVYVIAPTPFHPDGRIDDASIDRMTISSCRRASTGSRCSASSARRRR